MLDKDTLRRIYEQLGDALDNFAKDNHIYEIRIKVRARDFLISTYINTFDEAVAKYAYPYPLEVAEG